MKRLLLCAALCLAACLELAAQAPGPDAGIIRTLDGLPTVRQFPGCDVTGVSDSTACFAAALSANVGKVVRVSAGIYLTGEIDIPSGTTLLCDAGVELVRNGTIATGKGWIDLNGDTGSGLINCILEGGTTTPATFDRASLGSAVSTTFTQNSCIWIHGGTNIWITGNTLQHCGGYPQIDDASAAVISGLVVRDNIYQNNRSFLFGSPGDYNYGSWQGGILNYTSGAYYIENASFTHNVFQRNTGHGIFWDAANGNTFPNHGIIESENTFRVIGLDGILNSGMSGVTVDGNTFDSIGFISVSDGDNVGTARWYNGPSGNVNAVAIDHASVVVKETLTNNTMRLINGGCIDGDGQGNSKISGNTCSNPMPADADFNSAVAAAMGPAVYGAISSAGENWAYGYSAGNTNNTTEGGNNLSIEHNSFYGLGCSIKFYGGRNSHIENNLLTIPGDSNSTYDHNFCSPITLGTVGTGANQRAYNNTVSKNKVVYSGSSGLNVVVEDSTYGAFSSGDRNVIYDNDPTPTGSGSFAPFSKDANSSSVAYGQGNIAGGGGLTTSTFTQCNAVSGSATPNCIQMQPETSGGSTSLKWYKGSNQLGQLTDQGVFYAGSAAAGSGFGVVSSGGSVAGVINASRDFYSDSLSVGSTASIAASAAGLALDNNRNAYLATLFIGTNGSSPAQVINATRDFYSDSLSVGSTATIAASAAGLTIDNSRNAYLESLFIGTNGSSPMKVVDSSGNHTGVGFWGGSSVTGAQQFIATATTGTGCSSSAPCVSLGNISGLIQTNAASTVSFAAPVGFGGTINATGLGTLSGAGSSVCLDGSGFLRSAGCPGGPPSGSASGDLNGSYPAPTLASIGPAVQVLATYTGAGLQAAICALPANGGSIIVNGNLTLTANITLAACGGSPPTSVVVRQMAGVTISPANTYTIFGSPIFASSNPGSEQVYQASTTSTGGRIFNTGMFITGGSDCSPSYQQTDAVLVLGRCSSDAFSGSSGTQRTLLSLENDFNGATGTTSSLMNIMRVKNSTSNQGSAMNYSVLYLDPTDQPGSTFEVYHAECHGGGTISCAPVNVEGSNTGETIGVNINTGVDSVAMAISSASWASSTATIVVSSLEVGLAVGSPINVFASFTTGYNVTNVVVSAISGSGPYSVSYPLASNPGSCFSSCGSAEINSSYIDTLIQMHHSSTNSEGAQRILVPTGTHTYGTFITDCASNYAPLTATCTQGGTFTYPFVIDEHANSFPALTVINQGNTTSGISSNLDFWGGAVVAGNKLASIQVKNYSPSTYSNGRLDILLNDGFVQTQVMTMNPFGIIADIPMTIMPGGSGAMVGIGASPTTYALEVTGVSEASLGFYTGSSGTTAVNAPNGGGNFGTSLAAFNLLGQTTSQYANDTLFVGANTTSMRNFFIDRQLTGGQFIWGYNTPIDTVGREVLSIFDLYNSGLGHGSQGKLLSLNSKGTSSGTDFITLCGGCSGAMVGVGGAPTTYAFEVTGVSEASAGFYTGSGSTTAVNAPSGTVASLYTYASGATYNTISAPSGGVSAAEFYIGSGVTIDASRNHYTNSVYNTSSTILLDSLGELYVGGTNVIDSGRAIHVTGVLNSGGLQASSTNGLTLAVHIPGGITCGGGTLTNMQFTGGLFTGCF